MTPTILARVSAPIRRAGLVAAAAAGMTLGACAGDDPPVKGEPLPISHSAAMAAATDNTRTMLDFIWRAERFLDAAEMLEILSDSADTWFSMGSSAEAPLPPDPMDSGADAGLPPDPMDEEEETGIFLPVTEEGLREIQSAIEEYLEEIFLVESHIETQTRTSLVYRPNTEAICGELEDPADCRTGFAALDIRIAVSSVTNGDIDVRVLAGADRSEVALLEVHANTLAATLNMGPLVDAALRLESAIDPEAATSVVGTARGSVRLALRRLSETTLRATLDIVSPVQVDATTEQGEVSIVAEAGAISLEVNPSGEDARLEVDVRSMSVSAPQAALFDEEGCYDSGEADCTPPEGQMTMYVDRLAGIVGLVERNVMGLNVEGLLVGPVGVKFDARDVMAMSIGDGRTPVDVTFLGDDTSVLMAINGAMDLAMRFNMRADDKLLPIESDGWMADETLSIATSAGRTMATVEDDRISLEEGRIVLTSKARPDLDRTIEAGQCVLPVSEEETLETPHPFDFEVTACEESAN